MRKNTVILFALLASSIYFAGCSSDNPVVTPVNLQSTKGAYILSEGTLSPGASTLSFYSTVKDSFYLNIFSNGTLGLYPDGIQIYNNNLYVSEQGNFGQSGKVHKLDTTGRQVSENPSVGTNPYSLIIANNKIYVTNGSGSNVSVLDLNSLTLIKTIPVGAYPQEVLAIGNKVFVGNKSVFGGTQDSTISVIDVTHDSVIAVIVVRKDPSALAVTNDGKLLVGCPGPANIIYKVDPATYLKTDSMTAPEGFISDISVDLNSTNIYFIGGLSFSGDRITKLDLSAKVFTTIITANTGSAFYGYGFDSDNKKHYVLDAHGFTGSGSLYIYDINNSLKNTFTTGVAPRRVVFKRD